MTFYIKKLKITFYTFNINLMLKFHYYKATNNVCNWDLFRFKAKIVLSNEFCQYFLIKLLLIYVSRIHFITRHNQKCRNSFLF